MSIQQDLPQLFDQENLQIKENWLWGYEGIVVEGRPVDMVRYSYHKSRLPQIGCLSSFPTRNILQKDFENGQYNCDCWYLIISSGWILLHICSSLALDAPCPPIPQSKYTRPVLHVQSNSPPKKQSTLPLLQSVA